MAGRDPAAIRGSALGQSARLLAGIGKLPVDRFVDPIDVIDFFAPTLGGKPREQCTMPLSPAFAIGPDTLLGSPVAVDGMRFYLPRYELASDDVDGFGELRVLLRRVGAARGRLEISLVRVARAGGSDPLKITETAVLTYATSGGVPYEHRLQITEDGANSFTAAVEVDPIDDLYHAMTRTECNCRLVLRCGFDAAVPMRVRTRTPLYQELPRSDPQPAPHDDSPSPTNNPRAPLKPRGVRRPKGPGDTLPDPAPVRWMARRTHYRA